MRQGFLLARSVWLAHLVSTAQEEKHLPLPTVTAVTTVQAAPTLRRLLARIRRLDHVLLDTFVPRGLQILPNVLPEPIIQRIEVQLSRHVSIVPQAPIVAHRACRVPQAYVRLVTTARSGLTIPLSTSVRRVTSVQKGLLIRSIVLRPNISQIQDRLFVLNVLSASSAVATQ